MFVLFVVTQKKKKINGQNDQKIKLNGNNFPTTNILKLRDFPT